MMNIGGYFHNNNLGMCLSICLLMCSCSENEQILDINQDIHPIQFTLDQSNSATRGSNLTQENIAEFDVWAYVRDFTNTEKLFMGTKTDGVQITRGSSHGSYSDGMTTWGYQNASEIMYWTSAETAFIAVSPAISPAAGSESEGFIVDYIDPDFSTSTPSFTYQSDNVHTAASGKNSDGEEMAGYGVFEGQRDILIGATKVGADDNLSEKGPVTIKMHHIQSKIKFFAKLKSSNSYQVNVGKIEICNVKLRGAFSLTPEYDASGQATLSSVGWSDNSAVDLYGNYHVNFEYSPKKVTSTSSSIQLTSDCYVIPQSITPWNSSEIAAPLSEGTYLMVYCNIYDPDVAGLESQKWLVGTAEDDFTSKVYVPFPANQVWEPSKTYIYTLEFGKGMDQNGTVASDKDNYIQFSVSNVEPWGADNVIYTDLKN